MLQKLFDYAIRGSGVGSWIALVVIIGLCTLLFIISSMSSPQWPEER
jgi:hypothetical protein